MANGSVEISMVGEKREHCAALALSGFEDGLFNVRLDEPPRLLPLFKDASKLFEMRAISGIEAYPYTAAFDEVCERLLCEQDGAIGHLLRQRFDAPTLNSAVWRMLLYLRKNRQLKLGSGKREQGITVRYAAAERSVMRQLLMSFSRSDCESLPYTVRFTELAHSFRTKSPYPPRGEAEIWKLVILIAKSRRRPTHPEFWPRDSR